MHGYLMTRGLIWIMKRKITRSGIGYRAFRLEEEDFPSIRRKQVAHQLGASMADKNYTYPKLLQTRGSRAWKPHEENLKSPVTPASVKCLPAVCQNQARAMNAFCNHTSDY